MQINRAISDQEREDLASRHANALQTIAPSILTREPAKWQQRKSAQTKHFMLTTAIDCLSEYGYALTTTQLVAQKAGISRGALLHHFATKQDLIKQTIEFTFYCYMDNFYLKVIKLSERERVVESAGLDVYWELLHTKVFDAYRELGMASRTDEELREIFLPKEIQFRKIWAAELPFLFPEWQGMDAKLQLANDLIHTTFHGLLISGHIQSKTQRIRLRKLIATVTKMMRANEL